MEKPLTKTHNTVWSHLYKMSKGGKTRETKNRLLVAKSCEKQRNGEWLLILFGDDENILKLVLMVVQHWLIHTLKGESRYLNYNPDTNSEVQNTPTPSNSPTPTGCPITQLNSNTIPRNSIRSHRLRGSFLQDCPALQKPIISPDCHLCSWRCQDTLLRCN